jgi:hypothetical protein
MQSNSTTNTTIGVKSATTSTTLSERSNRLHLLLELRDAFETKLGLRDVSESLFEHHSIELSIVEFVLEHVGT